MCSSPKLDRDGIFNLYNNLRSTFCFCLALIAFACNKNADSDIVATSKLGLVTQNDLHKLLLRATATKAPSSAREAKAVIIREHFTRLAMLNEAKARGLENDPDFIAEVQENWIRTNVQSYLKNYLEQRTQVSQEEIKSYVDRLPEKHWDRVKVRHIFKSFSDETTEVIAREEIQRLHDRITTGARLDELARTHSDSQTARVGGDMGWIALDEVDPSLRTLLDSLEVGQVSKVTRTPVGYHVFMVEGRSTSESRQIELQPNEITSVIKRKKNQRCLSPID